MQDDFINKYTDFEITSSESVNYGSENENEIAKTVTEYKYS